MSLPRDEPTARRPLPTSPPPPEPPNQQSPPPPPPQPNPWTWRCLCRTRNPISKPRCLNCSRFILIRHETGTEHRRRSKNLRELCLYRNEVKNTPLHERDGLSIPIIDARIKKLNNVGSQTKFDHAGWMAWLTWKDEVEAEEEIDAVDESGSLSARMMKTKKAIRDLDVITARRRKKEERRERLRNGAGDCSKDCRWPSDCSQVLKQVLMKEELEKIEADKRARRLETTSHSTPAPPQREQPGVESESWYPQRSGEREEEEENN